MDPRTVQNTPGMPNSLVATASSASMSTPLSSNIIPSKYHYSCHHDLAHHPWQQLLSKLVVFLLPNSIRRFRLMQEQILHKKYLSGLKTKTHPLLRLEFVLYVFCIFLQKTRHLLLLTTRWMPIHSKTNVKVAKCHMMAKI